MGNTLGTIGTLNYYLNMLLTGTIIAFLIVGAIAYYLLKVKKVMAKEEVLDYSKFERVDTDEYAKFDNIIDIKTGDGESSMGVMVINERTFLGILDVTGYNFHTASAEDRLRTISNSVAFFNMVESPIQLRQSSKAIDISYNIQRQVRKCEELEYRLLELELEWKDTLALSEIHFSANNTEIYNAVSSKLDQLQREINTTRWLAKESLAVLEHMRSFTKISNASKINQVIFSYTYNPDDYTEELSEEEIYIKASYELATMGANYSNGLMNCGCSCKFHSGREMIELIRRHFHPKTADELKISELFGSSFQSLFITSSSILDAAADAIGKKKLGRQMEEWARQAEYREEHYKEDTQEYAAVLKENAEHYAENNRQLQNI